MTGIAAKWITVRWRGSQWPETPAGSIFGLYAPSSAHTGAMRPSRMYERIEVPRFNPPPGWPEPPAGWVPPSNWHPDPSWPAAPVGWSFWTEDDQAPSVNGVSRSAERGAEPHTEYPIE